MTLARAATGGFTVMPDLAMVASRIDGKALRFPVQRVTARGAPVYDLGSGETLATGAQAPLTSGGDQALVSGDGWTVLTVAPEPFGAASLGGVYRGVAKWSYPSLWPGLHASHESPPPDRPGQLIGTTRLLGGFVIPPDGDAGPLWCVNGNADRHRGHAAGGASPLAAKRVTEATGARTEHAEGGAEGASPDGGRGA